MEWWNIEDWKEEQTMIIMNSIDQVEILLGFFLCNNLFITALSRWF